MGRYDDRTPPISMEVYRQIVFDCGAKLLEKDCDVSDVARRLIALADRPVEDTAVPARVRDLQPPEPACDFCRHLRFDLVTWGSVCNKGHEAEAACDDYDSMFMQFPMTLNGIDMTEWTPSKALKDAELVAVRPANEEKTYLGFLLDGLGSAVTINYSKDTKILHVHTYSNPPILVPALRRVVFGYESWWRRIKSEADFKDITDDDIDCVFYVRALGELNDAVSDAKKEKERPC